MTPTDAYQQQLKELIATRKANQKLLAALETIAMLTETPHWDTERRYKVGEIARAAIAKATGA